MKHTIKRAASALTLTLLFTAPAFAQAGLEAAARGLEIAQEADRRDNGFGDSTTTLTMTLRNSHGQTSERVLRTQTLEVEGDGDKSLNIFDEPRDVSGTAFLSFTHSGSPDDQWLYLPSLKRVKRISSANKSGPFMGSEFAYEDIASQEVAKYTYTFVAESELDGVPVYVIERVPTYDKSGYTRQVIWYDQAEYRQLKADFYDRKGSLLKTLESKDYEQYVGKYWRALRLEMTNHQTGKSTTLSFAPFEFRTGLTDRDFDQSSLRLAR
ncbi:MAG: outer membrane lipoprotein-sorting protein [Rhodothermales bacterium]|jgi:outer membrane lipoprotein-sorting protein